MKNIIRYVTFASAAAFICLLTVFQADAGVLRPQLVSHSTTGNTGNGGSTGYSTSANGRYVVFHSNASDLVPGLTDINNTADIFLYDAATDTIRCLSLTVTAGAKTGNGPSFNPIISADGRYVVFTSSANDLVTDDANNRDDIFRYDTATNQIAMVSLRADGTQGGNGHSGLSSGSYRRYDVSDDGRFIVFTSLASDLTALPDTNAGSDVFVRDMQNGTTTLVSKNAAGNAACNNASAGLQFVSLDVSMSSDGNTIAYQSACDNLEAGIIDGNLGYDVIVYNRATNQNKYVSRSINPNLPNYTASSGSVAPVLSKNGSRIVFISVAVDVASPDSDSKNDVFVYDVGLRANFLVSVNSSGTNSGNAASEGFGDQAQPSITPDGRYIVFQSGATDLDASVTDTSNTQDVFRRDLATGTTKMVSVNVAGTNSGNTNSYDATKGASISDDGRFVAFYSNASTLLRENFALDSGGHSYVRDMLLGNTFTSSANTAGTAFANNFDLTPVISRNGKVLVTGSYATNLVPNADANANSDVFRVRLSVPQTAISDFNGDGLTDLGVYRPSAGYWYVLSDDFTFAYARPWGTSTDIIAPADYTGDGATDYAVFRNGTWLINDGINFNSTSIPFGQAGDKPMPGDFDGDGKADVAVFRPSTGTWYWQGSSNGQFNAVQFGLSTDIPIQGDFDGDGKADIAVFRPSDGNWYIRRSSDAAFQAVHFGQAGDKPVPADYDGDGKTDVAVFRAGTWYILNSGNGAFTAIQFGVAGDIPVPGSYDADGRADIAVWRPSEGNWYINRSANNAFAAMHFGQAGDMPAPAAFIP